jgi:hypothetical protein
VKQEAQFLLDRLDEYDPEDADHVRDWYGHVCPAIARLRMVLEQPALNVYTCTDHSGHWPVGVASIVVAETEMDAKCLLVTELASHGIKQDEDFTLVKPDTSCARAIVLRDGDY